MFSPTLSYRKPLPSVRLAFHLIAALAIATGSAATALAAEKPVFEERFTGKLAEGWTWIDEVPGSRQLLDGELELKVLSLSEGIFGSGRKHPNLLLRNPGPAAEFAFEVQLKSRPSAQFEHAGLLLYVDGDHYVALCKEMLDKPAVMLIMEKGGKPVHLEKPYENEEICLRLTMVGKKAIAQYRHYDSDEWLTLGEHDLPSAGPYKVGLYAGGAPKDADHRARFAEFRILPKSAAAVVAASSVPAVKEVKPAVAAPAPKKRVIRTDIPLAVQARQTAERAIPYVEKDGTAWINSRKCLSCHYAGYMLWSFHDARARGFDIDEQKFADWTVWSLSQKANHGAEGAAQSLLGRDPAVVGEESVKSIETLRDFIVGGQEKDGFWKAGGQLPAQKRPLSETNQVSTMICVLGLATLDPADKKATESRAKAVAWIKSTPPNGKEPAVSGEWYTMRLLVEKRYGDKQEVEKLRDKILAAQQADGGWGWLWADKSDAFGTGLALYALAEAGVSSSNPAIERAWKFLIETQTEAGSWVVHGTKTANKDQPHAMSGFWGSTWALMGLSKTLPDSAMTTAATQAAAERPR